MLPAQLYVIVAVHAFVPLPYFPHETVVPARYPNARQQVLKHNAVVQRVLANRGAIYGLGAESRFPGVIIAVYRKHHVVSCRSFIETNPVVPHQACGYHLRPRHSVLISQRFPIGILTYPAVIFLPGFHLPERIRVRALRPKNNHVVIRKGECIQHIQNPGRKKSSASANNSQRPFATANPQLRAYPAPLLSDVWIISVSLRSLPGKLSKSTTAGELLSSTITTWISCRNGMESRQRCNNNGIFL